MRRLKILLSAYACEPERGSEPEVGWQWANHLATLHDITVITRSNNRHPIERALTKISSTESTPNFIYFDLPQPLLHIKRKGSWGLMLYYLLWQIGVRLHLRKALSRYDIIHHLTFNSFRLPGFWWFTGRPVVLGPLGGGQVTSKNYLPLFRQHLPAELLRSLGAFLSAWNPLFLLTCQQAKGILTANKATSNRIPSFCKAEMHHLLETGISASEQPAGSSTIWKGRILWVGNLEKWKAGEIALRAVALAKSTLPSLHLSMVGEGRDLTFLKQTAKDLNIQDCVQFTGRLSRKEVMDQMKEADVLLFTSIRDTSGNVVLEAMVSGLPVIAICHHGVAEICTNETSILVHPTNIRDTVKGFAGGILSLARDPILSQRLADTAKTHVIRYFSWKHKTTDLSEFYTSIITY